MVNAPFSPERRSQLFPCQTETFHNISKALGEARRQRALRRLHCGGTDLLPCLQESARSRFSIAMALGLIHHYAFIIMRLSLFSRQCISNVVISIT